ncbi:MAG: C40 family peptidase [Brumimicrobium sp.]|nr:C40 family peptidase [Brumimicrobium sp.]
MKSLLLIVWSLFFAGVATSQVLEFDQLEMRYDQGHYKNVYRKARRLLDNPSYDFSYIPEYYLALSKLQLAQNDKWYKRHKYAVSEAKRTLSMLQESHEGRALLEAHVYELSGLKADLQQWLNQLKLSGEKYKSDEIQNLLLENFSKIPDINELREDNIPLDNEIITESEATESSARMSDQRKQVVQKSEELLGIPYKWAGTTPQGFDCSGFTSYVMKTALNKNLERRAVDQYNASEKIKAKNAKPGDLVFFDNGSGISHVGIVYSTNNNSIQMIHASTSAGISIIDIYQSNYWKQRIAGFGRYLE